MQTEAADAFIEVVVSSRSIEVTQQRFGLSLCLLKYCLPIIPDFGSNPLEHAEDTFVFLRMVEYNPLQLEAVSIELGILLKT